MLVLWKDKITTGLSSKLYSMYSSILRAKKKNLLSNNLAAEVRKMINLFLAKFLGKAILCQKKKPLKIQKNHILSILAIRGVFRDTFLFKSTRAHGHCCLNSSKYNS